MTKKVNGKQIVQSVAPKQEVTVQVPPPKKEEYPNTIEKGKKYTYNFWKNKPVAKFEQEPVLSEQIEADLKQRTVYGNDESIKLPDSMKWNEVNMTDNDYLQKIVLFLQENYVVDVKNKFRLDYTPEFLRWALLGNSCDNNSGFLLTIVNKESDSICGVIGASIQNITVFDKTEKFGVVNFLCAHPMYRKKKIAFTLIDEAVRRIVRLGANQGCFTTERCVPTPTTVMRYYHRPINYLKLQKHEFCEAGGNPEVVQKKFDVINELPNDCVILTNEHVSECYKLYNSYMSRFNIHYKYTEEEFTNIVLNNDFVKGYVVLNKENKVIDFMTYYLLSYAVMGSSDKLNSGYLFLHSCNNISGNDMVKKMFQILKVNNLDMLNITDAMMMSDVLLSKELKNDENSDAEDCDKVYEHKFLKGSGKLHFNFFNWKCPNVKPRQLFWASF